MSIQLKEIIDRHKGVLELNINGRAIKINFDEILYIEAMLRKVKIVTMNQVLEYKSSFPTFLKLINSKTFIHTQRSYAVNLNNILLSNNEKIPINDKYKKIS